MNSLKNNLRQLSNIDCLQYKEFDSKYNIDTLHPTKIAKDGLELPDFIKFNIPGNIDYQNTMISSIETMNSYFKNINDINEYTFLDLGSGKGRVILASMSQNAPYGSYKGLEAQESLWRVAEENLKTTNININKPVEFILGDIRNYKCNSKPTVYFFFHPVDKYVFDQFMQNNWSIISKSKYFLVFHLLQDYDVEKYTQSVPIFNDNFITIYSNNYL